MKVNDKVEHEGFGKGFVKVSTTEYVIIDFGSFEVTFDVKAQASLRII